MAAEAAAAAADGGGGVDSEDGGADFASGEWRLRKAKGRSHPP